MKIILKYILSSVKERKLRTLVMLLSVTLSTTLLFVSFGIGASYESAQRKMSIGYAGNARISVRNQKSDGWITKEDVPKVRGMQHSAGLLKARALYAEDGFFENFDLLAGEPADLAALGEPRVQSGDLAAFSGYQIALPDRFATTYGTQIGDILHLQIGDESYAFEVAALCAYDTLFLRNTRGFNALIPLETLSEIVGSEGAYSQILVVTKDGGDAKAVEAALAERVDLDRFRIAPVYSASAVAADARQKSMPFYLISFFALTISAFIIYSSYKIITAERLPVLGTFRSIGADEKTVMRLLMAESLVYGVLGCLLGIPIGFATLRFLLYGMSRTASYGIEIPMVVSGLNVLLSCGVAIVVSVLGAYVPVKRASKLPVKDVVLGRVEEMPMPKSKTLLFGAVLFTVSLLLPRVTSGTALTLAGGLSLLTLIVGAILIIPLFMDAASQVLEKVYGLCFGNIGRLAARNLRGNKNTQQNTVLLFISISALIVIRVVGGFVSTYVGDVFRGAALDGFVDAKVSAAFVQEVREIPTVTEVLPLYVLDDTVQVNGQSLRVEATDDLVLFNEMLAIHYTGSEQEEVENTFSSGRYVVLNEDALRRLDVRTGDSVTLSDSGASFTYTVTGSFKSRADDVAVVLPSSFAKTDFAPASYGFLAYQAGNPEGVMIQIRNIMGDTRHWSRTVKEFTNDASETINTFLAPMNKLIWFILLLATIGIINNLLINYLQRKRSIAMYRSVGLSGGQLLLMTLLESFSVGCLGALLSVFVSYFEIQTIFLVAGPKISMVPELSPSTFLFASLMGIVITLVGSLAPMMKSKKK